MTSSVSRGWFLVGVLTLLVLLFIGLFATDQKNTETQQPPIPATGTQSAPINNQENPKIEQDNDVNSSHDTDQTADNNCALYANNIQLTEQQKAQGLARISDYLRRIDTDFAHLDTVFYLAGINLVTGRELVSERSADFHAPPYFYSHTTFATKEATIIDEFIASKNPEQLRLALSEGDFNNYAYWGGDHSLVFVTAYIIQTQNQQLAEQLIPQLLAAGIVPHYSDLAIASQFHIDINMIQAMFDAGKLQADTILSYFGRKTSLLVMAVLSGNYQAAQLWLGLNSPIEPDHYAANALDHLFHRQTKYSQQQVRDLALAMLKQGASPNHSKTQEKLTKVLTKSEQTRFAAQLSPDNRVVLSQQEKQQLDSILNQLLELSWASLDNSQSNAISQPCREELGKQRLQQLVTSFEKNTAQNLTTSSPIRSDTQPDDQALIKRIMSQFTNQTEAERALIKGRRGIEAKQLIEKYRLQSANEKVKAALQAHGVDPAQPHDYTPTDTDKSVVEIQRLAAQGKWQATLRLAAQLNTQQGYELLFSLGLLHSAPWSVFETLIKQGTNVPVNAIQLLTTNDNAYLAELLMPYGLDLSFRDEFGYSAVANSVLNRAPNLLKLLIKEGVSVDEPSAGFDALDFALRDFSVKQNNAIYVEILIKAGAKINPSHKQWVEAKFHTDLTSYSYLVNYYPELAP